MAAPMIMRQSDQMSLIFRRFYANLRLCRAGSTTTRQRKGAQNAHQSTLQTFRDYKAMSVDRQLQANQSLLITLNGHFTEAYRLCQQYGPVHAVFPFRNGEKDYALIEMKHPDLIPEILKMVGQFPNKDKIPIQTRLLYMRSGSSRAGTRCPTNLVYKTKKPPEEHEVLADMQKCRSLRQQIVLLQHSNELTELGIRLRFLLCHILQETLRGTLPSCSITPFGSTVNMFGRHDCDLDMLLEFEEEGKASTESEVRSDLLFMSKTKNEDNRLQSQLTLDTIGGIISHFVPQMTNVRRILRARVPIVKFRHVGTGIECDLSIGNRSATYMSELLFTYSQLDERLRPLVYTIRHWAKVNDIIKSNPGHWLSNFMLTWMVIFFLQTRAKPVVPPIRTLQEMARHADERMIEGENVGFTTLWSAVPKSTNTQPIDELLTEFFKFYAELDLSAQAISVVDGCLFSKPELDVPFHLENPLERKLNASKNVSSEELSKFQHAAGLAAQTLQSSSRRQPGNARSEWGLSSILVNKEKSAVENEVSSKLNISMSSLFSGGEKDTQSAVKQDEDFLDVTRPITGSYNEHLDVAGTSVDQSEANLGHDDQETSKR